MSNPDKEPPERIYLTADKHMSLGDCPYRDTESAEKARRWDDGVDDEANAPHTVETYHHDRVVQDLRRRLDGLAKAVEGYTERYGWACSKVYSPCKCESCALRSAIEAAKEEDRCKPTK